MIIYYFNDFDSVDEIILERLIRMLPHEQEENIASTKLISRKRETAVSYLMLAHAIKNNIKEIQCRETVVKEFKISKESILFPTLLFSMIRFTTGPHGKPYISRPEGIFFNISHCKEAIAVGIADKEIGIDVEGRRRASEPMMSRSFTENELLTIKEAADEEMEFARIWTRKEAFFKWTGTGILIDHIKSVEQDALAAGCTITTQKVTPRMGNPFYLSIAI